MKKILITLFVISMLAVSFGFVFAKPAGYNLEERIFVGTGSQYCEQKLGITDKDACESVLGGPYTNDKLKMKWSEAWHMAVFGSDNIRNSNDELSWSDAVDQYGSAWTDNQWNGMFPGGSGENYHSRIVWVGIPCDSTNPNWKDGGSCIWGQFEVIMSHGTYEGQNTWYVHATPAGYGA